MLEKEAKKDTEVFDYTKGYIELIAQIEKDEKTTCSGQVSTTTSNTAWGGRAERNN